MSDRSKCIALAIASVLVGSQQLQAASGSWNVNASGNWKTSYADPEVNPWLDGIIAQGQDETANFNFDITPDRTVTLAENLTIGNLYFQDATTSSHNWILASSGGSILTLSTSTGTPTITAMGGTSRTTTITADIAASQGFIKSGSGTLFMSGAKTYTGNTTISAGRVQVNNNASLGTGTITLAGGTLGVNGWYHTANLSQAISVTANSFLWTQNAEASLFLSGPVTVNSGTTLQADLNGGAAINGSIDGAGTVHVNAGPLALNAANTVATTRISAGTLRIGNDAALGNQFNLTQRDSTATITATDSVARTIATPFSLSGKSGYSTTFGQATGGTGNLKFTGNGSLSTMRAVVLNTTEFSGNLTGTAALTLHAGSTGSMIFSGTNTFSGTVNVNAGTLLVNNNPALGSGTGTATVTVGGGKLGGSGKVGGAVTVNSGTLTPGNSAGQLTVGSLTLNSGATTLMEIGGTTLGTGYDNLTSTGALTYGGTLNISEIEGYLLAENTASYDLFDYATTLSGTFAAVNINAMALSGSGGVWTGSDGDTSYTFTESTGVLTVAVPEPATLSALGMLGAMFLRRRRA